MSVLDTKISFFRNCLTADNPQTITLMQFLTADTFKDRITALRKIEDKAKRKVIKERLPAATVSCTCSKRDVNYVTKHSGLIAFDIDLKDNQHITNYAELKQELSNLVHVAYCGISVSGRGYWGLIPIAYPEFHERHFLALEQDFRRNGIIIDPSPKSVVSLRIVSHDPEAYFNHKATPYKRLYTPKKARSTQQTNHTLKDSIEPILKYITTHSVDLTSTYEAWINCAFALASEYGEAGRDYFHAVSQQHPKYDEAKTDKKYDNVLKNGRGAVTMGSFIHLCKEYGVPVGSLLTQQPQGVRQGLKPVENHLSNIQLPPGRTLETLTLPWGKVTNEINANEYPAFWDN